MRNFMSQMRGKSRQQGKTKRSRGMTFLLFPTQNGVTSIFCVRLTVRLSEGRITFISVDLIHVFCGTGCGFIVTFVPRQRSFFSPGDTCGVFTRTRPGGVARGTVASAHTTQLPDEFCRGVRAVWFRAWRSRGTFTESIQRSQEWYA